MIVTGGSSGTGAETVRRFIRERAKVMICDVQTEAGEALADKIVKDGGDARFFATDVSKPDSVRRMVDETVRRFGKLDIAINNAGIVCEERPVHTHSFEDWERQIAVNLNGVFYCMKYEIERMLEQGDGIIVNTASIAVLGAYPKNAGYSASKHGVIGLTKTAAIEYARKSIRINAVCPGYTRTPMVENALENMRESEAMLTRRLPVGRLGEPQEIADAIVYLCSPEAGFITGHCLVLDGGITAL